MIVLHTLNGKRRLQLLQETMGQTTILAEDDNLTRVAAVRRHDATQTRYELARSALQKHCFTQDNAHRVRHGNNHLKRKAVKRFVQLDGDVGYGGESGE